MQVIMLSRGFGHNEVIVLTSTIMFTLKGPQGPQGVPGEKGPPGEGLPGSKVTRHWLQIIIFRMQCAESY